MIATITFLTAVFGDALPVVKAGGEFRHPRQPQLAVSSDGVVHLTFGDGNRIYYAQSKSASELQFGKPVKVAETPNLALGMRRGPRVASAGKLVVVSAISGQKGKGRDENLLAWRSTDAGKTWDGPSKVNDAPAAAREGLHAMAASADGSFVCAWIDLRTKLSDLRVSTSTDGRSWSPNTVAYQSPSGRVCECCQPSLAFDQGKLHLFWRNSLDGFRDMYRSTSADGGKTFSNALKLGSGSWTLNACPMDGGGFDVRKGRVATAWRRERIIYATFGDDRQETRLGDGEQPCIASTTSGLIIAWLKRRPGELLLLEHGNKSPKVIALDASDPVALSTPDGDRVILAWEGKSSGAPAIFVQSTDGNGGQ